MTRVTPATLSLRLRPGHGSRRGFALLVTIVLVAFLVLILVGLASFTRVETQVASNAAELARARQNALFALNIALGQLQQAAGPDQRVTATAEIDATAAATNQRWTGVWDSDPASATYGQRLAWLVSGETTDVAATVTDPGASGVSPVAVRLVGEHSADLSTTGAAAANRVNVPLQEIRGASVPGLPPVDGGHLIGRFGYWVGDEGVKARANLTNPLRAPWFTPAAPLTAPDAAQLRNDIGLAQRNAIEGMFSTSEGTTPISTLLPAATPPEFGTWVTGEQLPMSAADAAATNALREAGRARFHDVGFWSAGVQADVRRGGLKRDLSAAFEMNDADFQASVFANAAPAAERAVMAPGVLTDRFVSPIYNEIIPGASPAANLRGPTWHLFRSHYRLYKQMAAPGTPPTFSARALLPGSSPTLPNNERLPRAAVDLFNGAGVIGDPKTAELIRKDGADLVTPRPTRSALLPYINRIQFVVSLQTAPVAAPTGADPAQTIYEVRLVITPIVVLHNPHNVRLQLPDFDGDSYWGRLLGRGLPFAQIIRAGGSDGREFTARTGDALEDRVINLGAAAEAATNRAMSYNNMMRFFIPAMTLEPGEIRVFSPDLGSTVPIGLNMPLAANKYVESGYYLNQLNGQRFDYFGGPDGPATRQPWPIGPAGADVAPTDPIDHRVLVTGSTQIEAAVTMTKSGDGANIIRFNVESETGDSTAFTGDRLALFSELHVNKPDLGGGATGLAERVYAQYASGSTNNSRFCGGQSAANYAGEPVPIFIYDLYVKTPDVTSAYAARPFITSNPLAMVTEREALGNYSGLGNRRGFAMTGAPMQPRYRWFPNGASWTTDILDADPDGFAYWGPAISEADGLSRVSLIEVPTHPMTSIAQFQHLMVSLYSHEPYFAIGNSESSPFIPPIARYYNAIKGGQSWHFGDTSYLNNEALWDSSFFSTLAPGFDGATYYVGIDPANADSRESVRDAWLSGSRLLPNTRVRPYLSPGVAEADRAAALLDPLRAAANLLVAGSFNINSRSVEAWVAVLSGAREAAVVRTDGGVEPNADTIAMPRSVPSAGAARDDGVIDRWNGFARLSDTQIRDFATRIVEQIELRQTANGGRPFLSLAEFVNRALRADALGRRGAIQSAIESAGLNSAIPGTAVSASTQSNFPVPENGLGNSASAAAGHLMQADVLQQIGPFLSARSDTFTIRTYGEVVDPLDTTRVISRAWCEAVVQRTPDYVGGEPAETSVADLVADSTSDRFGRQFQIVYFRWLRPEDI